MLRTSGEVVRVGGITSSGGVYVAEVASQQASNMFKFRGYAAAAAEVNGSDFGGGGPNIPALNKCAAIGSCLPRNHG